MTFSILDRRNMTAFLGVVKRLTDGITQPIDALLGEVDESIRCAEVDRGRIVDDVQFLYQSMKKPLPKQIIWCTNPAVPAICADEL